MPSVLSKSRVYDRDRPAKSRRRETNTTGPHFIGEAFYDIQLARANEMNITRTFLVSIGSTGSSGCLDDRFGIHL